MLAHDPFPALDWASTHGIRYVDFDTLLAASDIVSLHVPLLPETHHSLNEQTLARMKPGVFIVNTSRGKLIETGGLIAALSIVAILLHLVLRFGFHTTPGTYQIPLLATLGGPPLLYDLLRKLLKWEFGSDLLGGISIITSILLGEYLAGSIIVLMLSGGEALENYALRSASSVLAALG